MQGRTDPRRVLVVIVQGLGDVVLATPALRAIRRRFPAAHLVVAGRAACVEVLAHESYIDEIIALPLQRARTGWSALRGGWHAIEPLRRRRFDLLINLTTPLSPMTWVKSWVFARGCRARETWGPALRDCLLVGWRRERVRYRVRLHESHYKFRWLRRYAVRADDLPPRLYAWPGLSDDRRPRYPEGACSRLIGVAAGGARQSRQWPFERYREVIAGLLFHPAITVVLLGDNAERGRMQALTEPLGPRVVNRCGEIPIEALPAEIAALDVLICNDSGLMHVAAAVGTPLVALLGAEDPRRYAPRAEPGSARIFYRRVACSPCTRAYCGHRSCTAWIGAPDVVEAALRLLLADEDSSISGAAERGAARCRLAAVPAHPGGIVRAV